MPTDNETTTTPSPWLTAREAAQRAKCGIKTLYAAVHAGRLRAARLGVRHDLRFHVSWVDEWLNKVSIVNPDAPGDDVTITAFRRTK